MAEQRIEVSSITGIEEVQAFLSEAPKVLIAQGYLKALQAGSDVIRAELDPRIPIRESDLVTVAMKGERHPGDLKRALMVEITLDAKYRGGEANVGFGNQGFVARMVEYGHRLVGRKPKGMSRKRFREEGKAYGQVPPHPFMRPAADASADAAIAAVAKSLEETVKQNYTQGEYTESL